jgi:ribosomal protein S18
VHGASLRVSALGARFAAAASGSAPDAATAAGSSQVQQEKEERVRLALNTKVSPSGSADALFQEAIDAIRQQRASLELDPVFQKVETGSITKLKQDELELTRKVFQRIDPTQDMTSNLSHGGHEIYPYWSPFHKVRSLRDQVTSEFDEYAKLVSVAEQKRVRIQIKKALKRNAAMYNPYSKEFREYHGREAKEAPPKPFMLPDKHWERSPLQERLLRERITWRDVDIIQHFIADNGYILPRRTTMLTRRKQAELVKAVKTAQNMAVLPYAWKTPDYQAMPVMDPLQWMADRLTDRVKEHRDKRSRAMLRVMMERYPELNYRHFLKHEASRAKEPPASSSSAAE